MTKRITLLLLLVLGVGLAFSVSTAWASERASNSHSQWRAEDAGRIDVKVRQAGLNKSTSVVLYDQDWKAVSEVASVGGRASFKQLKVGDYHVVAYSDEMEESLAKDVPVFARQTTELEVKLDRALSKNQLALSNKYTVCGSTVTGSGSQLKIWNSYYYNDRPIVYYQCGHKVGKLQTYCSGCRAGTWRYTNTCQKVSPIIVNLPCLRGANKNTK